MIPALLTATGSFLVGSIPFGYLIGRFFYRADIRQSGSGNIGAMNALRTFGKRGAAAVLVLDAVKGALPVVLARIVFGGSGIDGLEAVAAAFAVLGHCFSPWLGWKGGKGVATSFGAIFALSWLAGLVVVGTWILGALVFTRYSSVGSMAGNLVSPIALWFFTGSLPDALYGVFAGLFIVYTHRDNVERLRAGRENPISLFGKKDR
ncbi:MAG: glycerol-3-phosphate 1-O-acyltransferase PlsY [Vulcanimicrobiaceae bacterium]